MEAREREKLSWAWQTLWTQKQTWAMCGKEESHKLLFLVWVWGYQDKLIWSIVSALFLVIPRMFKYVFVFWAKALVSGLEVIDPGSVLVLWLWAVILLSGPPLCLPKSSQKALCLLGTLGTVSRGACIRAGGLGRFVVKASAKRSPVQFALCIFGDKKSLSYLGWI